MEISNRVLLNSVDSLGKLNALKLPVRTSFKLAKLTRKAEVALKDYNKVLKELQDKHAEKDDEGEKVVVENVIQFVDQEAFAADFEELLECKNKIDSDEIFLNDLGSVNVEPFILYHLDWLLKE